MRVLENKYLLWAARLFLGFIFIYAGGVKIADPAAFGDSIANYRLVPNFLVHFVAITLPWIEVIAGILLIFGIAVKENATIFNALLVAFIVMILLAIIRGLDIECGCFGTSDGNTIGITKILENLGLLLLGLYIFLFTKENNRLQNSSDLT